MDMIKYQTTQIMSKAWNVSPSTAAEYCRKGIIPNARKDKKGNWQIPQSSIKPLKKDEIRKVIQGILALKNDPHYRIDYSIFEGGNRGICEIFKYLSDNGWIESFNEDDGDDIPYNCTVTKKGMSYVFGENQSPNSKIHKITEQINTWIPIVASVLSCIASTKTIIG